MIVTAPSVHFRTPGGVVVVDEGGQVPAEADEAQLVRLIAAGCVGKPEASPEVDGDAKPEPKGRAGK